MAPESVLEVTARALTYYLDVSAECTRRIVAVEGAVKAVCGRLAVAELASRASKDLAEQCIKVWINRTFSIIILTELQVKINFIDCTIVFLGSGANLHPRSWCCVRGRWFDMCIDVY